VAASGSAATSAYALLGAVEGDAVADERRGRERAVGQQAQRRGRDPGAVPARMLAVRAAPHAHARHELRAVVVPLLPQPQCGGAALDEVRGHDGAGDPHRRDGLVQGRRRPGGLDHDVRTGSGPAPARPALDRRRDLVGPVGSEDDVGAEGRRELPSRRDRVDPDHRSSAAGPRELHREQPDDAEPGDDDLVTDRDAGVVDGGQGDGCEAHERARLGGEARGSTWAG
jgi:hypothetical protein